MGKPCNLSFIQARYEFIDKFKMKNITCLCFLAPVPNNLFTTLRRIEVLKNPAVYWGLK